MKNILKIVVEIFGSVNANALSLQHQITHKKLNDMENLKNKIAAQSTEMLKQMASMLMEDLSDGTQLVFELVLSELENRMPEADFVNFCDRL